MIADVFGYGVVTPGRRGKPRLVSAGTHLYSRKAAMNYAVKVCTVNGGTAPGETWRWLYRQGYRIVRVKIGVAFAPAEVRAPR